MESLVQHMDPSWLDSRETSVLSGRSHSATDRPSTRYTKANHAIWEISHRELVEDMMESNYFIL